MSTYDLIGPSDYELAGGSAAPAQAVVTGPNTTPTTPQPTYSGGLTATQQSGQAILAAAVAKVGINPADLGDYLKELATNGDTIGNESAQLAADLYDPKSTPGKVLATKYPAIFARQDSGLPQITVAQYQSAEETYAQMAQKYNLTPDFMNHDYVDSLIANDVAPSELEGRLAVAQQAAALVPQTDRDELQRLYSIGGGDLTAVYAHNTQALPILQKQVAAAQLSGAAVQSGFGGLTQDQAEQFATQGVTRDQALSATEKLAQEQQLFGSLPGEQAAPIDQSTQLAAALGGNAAAQARIDQRVAARQAPFQGGGAFATDKNGIAGLAQNQN